MTRGRSRRATLEGSARCPGIELAGLAGLLVAAALVGGTIIGSVAAAHVARRDRAGAGRRRPPRPRARTGACRGRRVLRRLPARPSRRASASTSRRSRRPPKAAAIATIDAAVADGRAAAGRRRPAQGADRGGRARRLRAARRPGRPDRGGRRRPAAGLGVVKDGAGAAADGARRDRRPSWAPSCAAGKTLKDDRRPTRACPTTTVIGGGRRRGQGRTWTRPSRPGTIKPGPGRPGPRAAQGEPGRRSAAARSADRTGRVARRRRRRLTAPGTASSAGSVEDDDLAEPVAGPQPVEGVLEVVEPDPAVDEPLDRQAPVEVRARRSAGSRPPGRRSRSSSRGSGGCRRPADRPRTTARASNGVIPTSTAVPPSGRLSIASSTVVDAADRLEHEVRAAVGQVAQRLERGGPIVAGEQAVASRRPRAPRRAWPRPVDGDDPRRAREDRAHDARQPDAAEPDDRHAGAGRARRRS